MFTLNGELVIISRFKVFKSLKLRIFLVIVIAGVIPAMIVSNGFIKSEKTESRNNHINLIQTQAQILSNQIVKYNYLNDSSSEVLNGEISQLANIFDGRILIIDKNCKIIKDTYVIDENKTMISDSVINCLKGSGMDKVYDSINKVIKLTIPVTENVNKSTIGVILVYSSTENLDIGSANITKKVVLLDLICILILIAVAFLLSRALIKPFDDISKAIEEMSGEYLEEDITFGSYTETEHIADALNKMMAKMRKLDTSRQEFVSNVSHELKTPITSMKVLADSLLVQEDVPVELYKEFMTDIAEEIERENQIINDLLAMVKMDRSTADLNIAVVTINDLLELILRRLRPIAAKNNIELVLESFRPVTAEVDEVKITLALTNLIENAIKYNVENGWVHVSLNADHKFFYVKVSDSGIGIPEDSLDNIFERFYRVDKSHSREIGGTGLGLSIARNAILLHRGAIKVYSKENEGTTFTVRIPLIYVS